MKNNLLTKFLTFSYGGIGAAIIGFFTTIITARIMQPEEFGKTSMFILFINIVSILVLFGTDQAFVRFFYEEEENKRGTLLYNCLKICGIIFLPILVIFFVFRLQILNYLFDQYNLVLFLVIILAIIVQVLYRFAILVIRMQQKGNLFSLVQILNGVFIFGGVLLFYFLMGNTYKILVYSTILSLIILLLILIMTEKSFWSVNNIKDNQLVNSKKSIFYFSYPLVFTTAIMWVFEGSDKFFIRQWADFNELGLYSAAFKIIGIISIMKIAFTTFWTPVAFETFQKSPSNKAFFAKVSKIVSLIMMIVAIIVIMCRDIILMLLGSEYQEASSMLSFLVFIPIMYTISETTVLGINFYKKVKWHIFIVGAVCLVNIAGNWMLVPAYGGLGASISTGISYIIFFALRTFISLHYYKVDYGLKKVFTATIVVLFYATYTLWEAQPLNELLIGSVSIGIIVMIYFAEIRKLI